jgi:isopenicillin-N N-acyltransferase-like protein
MNSHIVPLIETRGNPLRRGQQQGEGARYQILASLAGYRQVVPKLHHRTWQEAVQQAGEFLPLGEAAFPQFVEEARGIAAGAGVPFDDVWMLNCLEDLLEAPQQTWGCTSVAVGNDQTASGNVLLAHNEDWSAADRGNVYLVHSEPDDGPPFLGMTYGPLLVNIGLNAVGIGAAINSVHPTDGRLGVPRILHSRAVLNARTIGQAIGACVPKERAGGYHYLLADANGELYGVETSATGHSILYGEGGWLAHTNHYLSPRLQALEAPGTHAGSHVRYNRARRLVAEQLGRVTLESLQALLRDHVNYPDSICAHPDPEEPPHPQDLTVTSLVMDLTERVIWATSGPPCEGEYSAYQL